MLGKGSALVGGLDIGDEFRRGQQGIFDVEDLVALASPLLFFVGQNDAPALEFLEGGIELRHLITLTGIV